MPVVALESMALEYAKQKRDMIAGLEKTLQEPLEVKAGSAGRWRRDDGRWHMHLEPPPPPPPLEWFAVTFAHHLRFYAREIRRLNQEEWFAEKYRIYTAAAWFVTDDPVVFTGGCPRKRRGRPRGLSELCLSDGRLVMDAIRAKFNELRCQLYAPEIRILEEWLP